LCPENLERTSFYAKESTKTSIPKQVPKIGKYLPLSLYYLAILTKKDPLIKNSLNSLLFVLGLLLLSESYLFTIKSAPPPGSTNPSSNSICFLRISSLSVYFSTAILAPTSSKYVMYEE